MTPEATYAGMVAKARLNLAARTRLGLVPEYLPLPKILAGPVIDWWHFFKALEAVQDDKLETTLELVHATFSLYPYPEFKVLNLFDCAVSRLRWTIIDELRRQSL